MCPQRDALKERRLAAELLGQACLAHVASPIGEALDRAYTIDPVIPEDEAELLGQLGGARPAQ